MSSESALQVIQLQEGRIHAAPAVAPTVTMSESYC